MGDQGAAKSPSNGLASIERDFDKAFVAVKAHPGVVTYFPAVEILVAN